MTSKLLTEQIDKITDKKTKQTLKTILKHDLLVDFVIFDLINYIISLEKKCLTNNK